MKKRSLFSAVAMLIVSALVLTSATFAWFASGTTATVDQISATISNSDGSILVSADGGTTWLSRIGQANFNNTTGAFAAQFAPVSVTPGTDPKVVGGQLDGSNFAGMTATAGSQYTEFTFKVKTTVDAAVTCTPAFTTAAAFGYALVIVEGQSYLYGSAASRTYNPIAFDADASSIVGVDSNNNYIMDSADSTCPTLAATATTQAVSAITLNTTANTPVDVRVLVWAEGQDAACYGMVDAQAIGISFSFTK